MSNQQASSISDLSTSCLNQLQQIENTLRATDPSHRKLSITRVTSEASRFQTWTHETRAIATAGDAGPSLEQRLANSPSTRHLPATILEILEELGAELDGGSSPPLPSPSPPRPEIYSKVAYPSLSPHSSVADLHRPQREPYQPPQVLRRFGRGVAARWASEFAREIVAEVRQRAEVEEVEALFGGCGDAIGVLGRFWGAILRIPAG